MKKIYSKYILTCIFQTSWKTNILYQMKCRDHCWFCDPRSFASQRDFCTLVHSTMDKVVLVVSFATIIWGHHTPFPSNDCASINHNPFLLLLSLTKIRRAVLFRFQKQLMWEEAMPDDPKWHLRRRLHLESVCCVIHQDTLLRHAVPFSTQV